MAQLETLSPKAQEFQALSEAISRALMSGPRSTKDVVASVAQDVSKNEKVVLNTVHDLISRGTLVLTETLQIRLAR